MADIYNDTNLTYDSYLEPEIDPFVQQILATTAITNINGLTGPTITFSGGTSGFSYAPAGATLTLVSPLSAKGDLYTWSTVGIRLPVGANGEVLSADSTATTGLKWIANAVGTVTSVSVVTANGFAGTVATATTTPAITLTTTITGVLKGDGTAISAAGSADIISALGYTPTNAAIVPSTAPLAGQVLVGNAGGTAYARQTISGSGATITLSSAGVLTISAIANASLSNASITIAGTSTALGGTITLDTITGVSANGFLKRTGANTLTNIADPLPVANGGTAVSSASLTAFNNITGFSAASTSGSTSSNLVFSAGPTFSGTVTSGGNISIANGQAVVFGTGTTDGYDASSSSHVANIYTNNSARLTIGSTGLVRFSAYGAGTATFDASGNITSVSDERLKRNVRPFTRGIKDLMGIEPILHGYTPESGLDQTKDDYAGFSAQNVQKLIPEGVGRNADGILSLSDRSLIAVLVNAVKELAELNKLKGALN